MELLKKKHMIIGIIAGWSTHISHSWAHDNSLQWNHPSAHRLRQVPKLHLKPVLRRWGTLVRMGRLASHFGSKSFQPFAEPAKSSNCKKNDWLWTNKLKQKKTVGLCRFFPSKWLIFDYPLCGHICIASFRQYIPMHRQIRSDPANLHQARCGIGSQPSEAGRPFKVRSRRLEHGNTTLLIRCP